MKEDEKILEQAINALKQDEIPAGPSEELVEATTRKLKQVREQPKTIKVGWLKIQRSPFKVAAAAVLLVAAGYAAGSLLAPKPPDIQELRSALEPAIRETLLDELTQNLQAGLTDSYLLLREETTEQYRQDLRQTAVQILTASIAATNQLLEELIESIDSAQAQNRQWFTAALGQVELNRVQDTDMLGNALVNLAVRTEDELQRTQQDVVQIAKYLSYTQPDSLIQNEPENLNDSN